MIETIEKTTPNDMTSCFSFFYDNLSKIRMILLVLLTLTHSHRENAIGCRGRKTFTHKKIQPFLLLFCCLGCNRKKKKIKVEAY